MLASQGWRLVRIEMLPDWLDVAANENAAAAKLRQLSGREGTWGELIASAQAVMGIYQDRFDEDVRFLYKERDTIPLIGTARILDAASQSSDIPEAERPDR